MRDNKEVEQSTLDYSKAIELGFGVAYLDPQEAIRRYREVMKIDEACTRGEIRPKKAVEMMKRINRGEI